MGELVPPAACAEEILGDDAQARLLPEEEHLVARAVASRRRDVTYARTCARRALARLGAPETPILRGKRGEPCWPGGVVGSMTHTAGYCAAAVAPGTHVRSLGIDAEPHDVLPKGVLTHVALPEEMSWLAERGYEPVCWDRLLFSAKESVYKAWYPLTRRWLGFDDALITINPARETFHAELLVDGHTQDGPPLSTLTGSFLLQESYVLTAVTIPRGDQPSPAAA